MNTSGFDAERNGLSERDFERWLKTNLGPGSSHTDNEGGRELSAEVSDGDSSIDDETVTRILKEAQIRLRLPSRHRNVLATSIRRESETSPTPSFQSGCALGKLAIDFRDFTEWATGTQRWTVHEVTAAADDLAGQLADTMPRMPDVVVAVQDHEPDKHGHVHDGGLAARTHLVKSIERITGKDSLPRQAVAHVGGGEGRRESCGRRVCNRLEGLGGLQQSRPWLIVIVDDATNAGETLLVVVESILKRFPNADVRCVVLAASTNLTRWSPRFGETRWRRCPVVRRSGAIQDITLLSAREIDYIVGFPWDSEVACSSDPGFVAGTEPLCFSSPVNGPGRLIRPWGVRVGLATKMANISELLIKPNEEISFHFHQCRQEMFYAVTPLVVDTGPNLKDKLDEWYGGDLSRLNDKKERLRLKNWVEPQMVTTFMQPTEELFFEPLRPHRIRTLPGEVAISLEFSRGDYRQLDIVRIDDRYEGERKPIGDPSDDIDIEYRQPWVIRSA